MKQKKQRFLPFRQAVPGLMLCQLVALGVTQLWLIVFSKLSTLLLWSTGKVAVTSGDYLFLFTSWQGIFILLLTILTLLVFIAFDIHMPIVFCGRFLKGEKTGGFYCCRDSIFALRRFLSLPGLAVILYIAFFSPLIHFGFSISLTKSFYIPKFISSVIYGNPLYLLGSGLLIAALVAVGVLCTFIFHGVLLDDMKLGKAARYSARLVKKIGEIYSLNF